MSLSFLRIATTSSVIDFTRTSGAGCWACARGISNAKSKQQEIFMAIRSDYLVGSSSGSSRSLGGKVENTGDPERRIEKNPAEVVHPLLKFTLQHIVHRNPDVLEVGKEIGNPGTQDSRHDPAVTLGHRLDHGGVHRIIEGEHRAVERLERVSRIAPRSGAARQGPGEDQRRAQPLGFCHALGFQSLLTSCRPLRRLYCTGTDR